MSAIAIYSTEYDPQRLYDSGQLAKIDDDYVEKVVQYGDAPLDLVVDVEQQRVLWSFKGERTTAASREDYFVIDYTTDGTVLFSDLADELKTLHVNDIWTFGYHEDLRWEAGFVLWRVESTLPDIDQRTRENLFDHLRHRDVDDSPVVIGMNSYRQALRVVKTIYDQKIDCTVAVGTDGEIDTLSEVDLLLAPDSERNFKPRSNTAHGIFENRDNNQSGQSMISKKATESDRGLLARFSAAVIVVFCAFALFSFFASTPVHPITGLATIGGLTGSILAYPFVVQFLSDSSDISPSRNRIQPNKDSWWSICAFGTFAAFGFPTLFRVSGALFGDSWLFGPVTTMGNSLISVTVFLGLLFSFGAVVSTFNSVNITKDRRRYQLLVTGILLYGASLLLATGLASQLWWKIIPSA